MCALVKVYVISFVLFVGAAAGTVKKSSMSGKNMTLLNDEMGEVMKLCNESFPTPKDHLKKLNETGMYPREAKQQDKCYLFCVLEQLEVVNEKGEVQIGNAADWVKENPVRNEKEIHDSVQKCVNSQNKNEKDVCEKSYQFVSCIMKDEIARQKMATTDVGHH